MDPSLNIAIRAARSAGEIIARSINHLDRIQVSAKGANDYVSEVDRAAEQEIIKVLLKAYPSDGILAEESAPNARPTEDRVWIIDPLDGTTNFLHGFPHFAVSIALRQRDRLEQAVIYDPIKDELFTASRGSGASLNNRRIRVTNPKSSKGVLLGTGFPFRDPTVLDDYLRLFRVLVPNTAGIRRAGSAALDLAYVAAGRLDGFWEIGLQPWDLAAGALLIQEAGGIVTDFTGATDYFDSGNILAASPKLHQIMQQAIAPVLPPSLA